MMWRSTTFCFLLLGTQTPYGEQLMPNGDSTRKPEALWLTAPATCQEIARGHFQCQWWSWEEGETASQLTKSWENIKLFLICTKWHFSPSSPSPAVSTGLSSTLALWLQYSYFTFLQLSFHDLFSGEKTLLISYGCSDSMRQWWRIVYSVSDMW